MALKQFASFYLGDNLFGIDVRLIREINRNIDITVVDSAPEFVRGLLNLRGQIVTVIDAENAWNQGAGRKNRKLPVHRIKDLGGTRGETLRRPVHRRHFPRPGRLVRRRYRRHGDF